MLLMPEFGHNKQNNMSHADSDRQTAPECLGCELRQQGQEQLGQKQQGQQLLFYWAPA